MRQHGAQESARYPAIHGRPERMRWSYERARDALIIEKNETADPEARRLSGEKGVSHLMLLI
jgi:hypothetical protein